MNVTIEYDIVGIPEHHIKITHRLPSQYAAYRCDFADPVLVTSPPVDIIYHTVTTNGCSLSNNIFIVKEPVQLLPKVKDDLSVVWCMTKGNIDIMHYNNIVTLLQGQYSCFQVIRQQPTLFAPGVYEVQHYTFNRENLSNYKHNSPLVNKWLRKIDGEIPALLTHNAGLIWDGLYTLNCELKYSAINSNLRRFWLFAKLQELLILILEHQDNRGVVSNSNITFNAIKTFIQNNLDKALTISQLANTYFISESKLRHDFAKYCGMPFSEYIIKVRMECARNSCIYENTSIAHIAYMVGYKNPSALTKVYKSHYGETPSETRRKGSSN